MDQRARDPALGCSRGQEVGWGPAALPPSWRERRGQEGTGEIANKGMRGKAAESRGQRGSAMDLGGDSAGLPKAGTSQTGPSGPGAPHPWD